MPMAVPTLIPNPSPLVMAIAMAALCSVLVLMFIRQEPVSRRRLLVALAVVSVFVGVRLYADTAIDPCRICSTWEPWSWQWIMAGCWGC